ncbi:MAG: PAS domain-containing protein [Candidatus Methanoperedens sp.]|nr:PAS domain-containing protein [Candidatus Methanoperedens sp.]
MVLCIYGASQIILMDSFDKMDEEYSRENVEIAENALNESIIKIDSTTGDWAVWDDSYFFVHDQNENFSREYLNADTNNNLMINLMVYTNLSGKIVGSTAIDLENQNEIPVPPYFSDISDSDVLVQHHGVGSTMKGIILLPEGPMLLSSWPITNKGELPVGGTIIMGRYLDESEIQRLSGITHLPLTIQRLDDVQMPSAFQTALSFLSKDNPIFIQQLSDKSIAGYTLINDIYGNPALILKVETLRVVHDQGKETLDYFLLLLVIIGIIFVAVFLYILKYFVLTRLNNLDAQVQDIRRSRDIFSRVSIGRIGKLSTGNRNLNKMMESLTLRNKILLIMGTVFLLLIILLFTASQIIVMDRFTSLEEQYSHQKTQLVRDTLKDDINKLSTTETDWASWNDTYLFINDRNEEYIRSNLRLEIFTNLRVNLMMFIHSSGNIVYGKAFDLENQTEVPVPRYFKDKLSPDDYLLQHFDNESNKTGILLIPESPMLVSSQPILDNDRIGPIRGTMIMGRFLNSKEIERISGIIHLPLSIYRFDDNQMPSDFQSVLPLFSKDEPIYIRPVSTESIAGYTFVDDIYGKPGVVLKVEVPRGISKQGIETMRYFILSLIMICSVFSIVIVALLEIFVLRRLNRFDSEVKNIGKSGTTSSRVVVEGKDELSNLAGSLNNMLDALEKSQEKVSKSEANNRAILEAMPDSILQIKKNGTISKYNGAKDKNQMALFQGCIGRNIRDVMPQNVAEQIMGHVEQTLLTKEKQIFQYQLIKESNICYYEARTVVFGEEEVLAIITDITQRRRAEELLNKSKEFAETVLSSMKDAICIINVNNFKIIDVNSVFLKNYGMKKEEVIGKSCYEITHKRSEPCIPPYDICPLRETLKSGEHSAAEHVHYKKDGEKQYVEVSTSPILDEHGRITKVIHVSHDITERKVAEVKIKASLEEKEVLLREIHHRVKNNMQIVSSLLGIQSQNIEDKKYKDIFIQSQTRIDSMSLIHQKLYQSESLAQINFKDYIDSIVSNIFESYCTKSNITFDLDVEDIPLKIDYAVPCGLIINELVTNCLKYAFPDERQGKIRILVKSKENNMIQLSISDDGIGIPKDLDIRNTESLGLRLVTSLAENQLNGEIILKRDSGTEFQVNFRGTK